ncbi:MAG: hypothetical protein JWQ35_308 [Bacteriovoracaceae bacterium]|nr:hypothetical protein [Bacteriovoracaceae bacterium]
MDQQNQTKTRRKIKKPAEVFKVCPICDCRKLIRFDGEVFCNGCDWNSVEINAVLSTRVTRSLQVENLECSPYIPEGAAKRAANRLQQKSLNILGGAI